MFFHKKVKHLSFDRENQKPVIRSSICTGEKTAGFRDMQTGKFEDIMCIRSEEDFKEFLELYEISPDEIKTEY